MRETGRDRTLRHLAESPRPVSAREAATALERPYNAVSEDLKVMRDRGLVTVAASDNQTLMYEITETGMDHVIEKERRRP